MGKRSCGERRSARDLLADGAHLWTLSAAAQLALQLKELHTAYGAKENSFARGEYLPDGATALPPACDERVR